MIELDPGTILYISNKELEGILPKVIRIFESYNDGKYFKCGEIKDDFSNKVCDLTTSDYEITIDQETMFKYYTAITPTSMIEIVKSTNTDLYKDNYFIYLHNNKYICVINVRKILDYLKRFNWNTNKGYPNRYNKDFMNLFERSPIINKFGNRLMGGNHYTVNKMNVYKNDNISDFAKLLKDKYTFDNSKSVIDMREILAFLLNTQIINMKFFSRILSNNDFEQDVNNFIKSIYNIENMINGYENRLSANDIDANSVYIIRYKRTTSIENLKKYMKRDRIVLVMNNESKLYVVGYNYDYSKNLMQAISKNDSALSKDEISKFLSNKTSK